jgi:hypothetical protein
MKQIILKSTSKGKVRNDGSYIPFTETDSDNISSVPGIRNLIDTYQCVDITIIRDFTTSKYWIGACAGFRLMPKDLYLNADYVVSINDIPHKDWSVMYNSNPKVDVPYFTPTEEQLIKYRLLFSSDNNQHLKLINE